MSFALYPAMFFHVALMVTTAYFLLGGLPLLILAHDVSLDARFVQSFFKVYYRAAFWASLGACLSYALWARWGFALGAGGLCALSIALRQRLLPTMQRIGQQIEAQQAGAVQRFRRVHGTALALNLLQLVLLVWATLQLSWLVAR